MFLSFRGFAVFAPKRITHAFELRKIGENGAEEKNASDIDGQAKGGQRARIVETTDERRRRAVIIARRKNVINLLIGSDDEGIGRDQPLRS